MVVMEAIEFFNRNGKFDTCVCIISCHICETGPKLIKDCVLHSILYALKVFIFFPVALAGGRFIILMYNR